MKQPDIPGALALLRGLRDDLARTHSLMMYRDACDDDRDLEGCLLDLRREHDAACRAIALLEPNVADLRDVLEDPNPSRTSLSFEASPASALQSAPQVAAAPLA